MVEIKDRISQALKAKEKTPKELSDITGIPISSISQYMSGHVKPKHDRIYLICNALHINEAWLLGYDVPMEKGNLKKDIRKIPLYSQLCCGTGIFVDENIEDYIVIPDRMVKNGKEYFANTAIGDSMVGKGIKEGDVIIFEKTNILENGDIGSFCIDDGNCVCKIFRKLNNGMILLESANDKYDPIPVDLSNECFRIVGKYIGMIKIGE